MGPVPLSVGLSGGGRAVAALGCVFLIGFGAALTGGAFLADPAVSPDGPMLDGRAGSGSPLDPDRFDVLAAGVGDALRLVSLCGVPALLVGAYLLARVVRRAAWLSSSQLTVRGAVLTRTVDLSRAAVAVDGWVLLAHDPVSDGRVRLPLRGLPRFDLLALASSVPAGPAALRLRELAAESV